MAKPTMSDVATRAGVDVSTVSRALNPKTAGMLRTETVERVVGAARALGYRPNALARGLRTQRSHTVGMLIPDLTNPFFPPIVRGVEDALETADYTLIVANTDNDPRREERSLQTLIARQVDGLLIATSHVDGDEEEPFDLSLPVVLVNRRSGRAHPSIVPDDSQGVALVVEHLLGLGHRHVGHIAGPADTSTGRTRATAFSEQATKAGVFDPRCVQTAPLFAVEEGRQACDELLERCPELTAIFAANDLLAVGCLRAVRARGLRVPDDISLVGFNDMPLVDLLDPPLTTVRVPQYDMGFQAGQLLLARLATPAVSAAPAAVELPGSLIVRRSTAAPA
jgi:LacI family transcriptional regulator